MKSRSIFYSVLLASAAFTFFTNCSREKKEDAIAESTDGHESHDLAEDASNRPEKNEASLPQFQTSEVFQQQLAAVYTSYLSLKEAFVSSNVKKVKAEVSTMDNSLTKVDMKLVTGAAHHDGMSYLSAMQASLKEISRSSDIETQRKAFSTLSDNLYKSAKAFGLGGKTAFYEFCPMAFNNEGGYWLSDNEQIRNPYFGEAMLTCGSVKEQLK